MNLIQFIFLFISYDRRGVGNLSLSSTRLTQSTKRSDDSIVAVTDESMDGEESTN